MNNVLIILFLCVAIALGQSRWTQWARVRAHTHFFSEVIQETVYEIERRGFSTLTLTNITKDIDLQMYKWHVEGTAVYTNGFVVSIQKIDVTQMSQLVSVPTIDGVVTPRATVRGTLNLRDIKLGYDVNFTPVNGAEQTYTGDFTHGLISWAIDIVKDLTSKEVTLSMASSTSGGVNRVVYRPANNVTEVISRTYSPSDNANGVRTWSTIIGPIILDVIKKKVPFPEVCYSHC